MMIHSSTNQLGVSFGFHDAAVAAMFGSNIVYASHSERYSRLKNDAWLHQGQIDELDQIGMLEGASVSYYERPSKKRFRQALYGQPGPSTGVGTHIKKMFGGVGFDCGLHHKSHAAAGYYTSPFEEAAVIVVDAVGEWDTISVWIGRGDDLHQVYRIRYPNSMGLLYSAFTQRCGLKPNEEEFILMGMAGFGTPCHVHEIYRDFVYADGPNLRLKRDVHRGIGNWMPEAKSEDLAASIQHVLEEYLVCLFKWTRRTTGMRNVVFQGGVALNCVANTRLIREGMFDDYWIMPNPGDAGASMGAVLATHGRRVEWPGPYLGTYVSPVGSPDDVVSSLLIDGVCGIAQGRSEFGPRALGNRSLLADPREPIMQNRVNTIKKRDMFRPFAPVVLAEFVDDYFETYGVDCRYMQFALRCKKPEEIPAVVHVDGTSRVQTAYRRDNQFLHKVLSLWYEATGCPVLLNTSLNIKGEPLVNTRTDAVAFAEKHDVRVY